MTSSETARYLVLLEDNAVIHGARELHRLAGIRTVSTADAAGASAADLFGAADGLVLHGLGVALVTAGSDQVERVRAAMGQSSPFAAFEQERTVYAIGPAEPAVLDPAEAEGEVTWGLDAVGIGRATATGKDVRVAMLDTGFDAGHPDFAGRDVVLKSFVEGQENDGHGHGTHVTGTACGPRHPQSGKGFGIAEAASIYAGKVLSDEGSGNDGGILAGIEWAIANGCAVVSMSLGAPTQPGQAFSEAYERVARRAMEQGTLIIAAAGNESQRGSGVVAPVGHPANCPSIMAVAASDAEGAIADFSCGTVDAVGQVDVTGPGVDVYSSVPGGGHQQMSGTSMATPHASGVAALLAEKYQARSWDLWARMTQSALRMPLPSTDVGSGMVQAP